MSNPSKEFKKRTTNFKASNMIRYGKRYYDTLEFTPINLHRGIGTYAVVQQ